MQADLGKSVVSGHFLHSTIVFVWLAGCRLRPKEKCVIPQLFVGLSSKVCVSELGKVDTFYRFFGGIRIQNKSN